MNIYHTNHYQQIEMTATTVPLCATHHRSLHTMGDEEKWWKGRGINPIIHAEELWRERWGEAIQQPSRARELLNPSG